MADEGGSSGGGGPNGDSPGGGSVLLVPIHLDALWLDADLSVVEAKVDFTRLPYRDGAREVNRDVANLSEELLARPLEDRGLQLRKGIHLHWALPTALTRGTIDEQGTTFPAAPNRWLVTRSRPVAGTDREEIERQWIVESDYLSPHAARVRSGGVAIPFILDDSKPGGRPWTYLGRRRLFEHWTEAAEQALQGQTLGTLGYQLTALGYQVRPGAKPGRGRGYAEPTFAALYPNCQSVFGFHDEDPPAGMKGIRYDVVGWYGHPGQDDCLRAVERAREGGDRFQAFDAALVQRFQWHAAADGQGAPPPGRSMFHGSLVFETGVRPAATRPRKSVTVAVGNTSTEALSAYLAHTVAPTLTPPLDSKLMEEQLEALHLAPRLGSRKLDVGLKFQEARHERGFTGVGGGMLWGIRRTGAGREHPGPADDGEQETLPDELAHLLNALNVLQADYDRAGWALESMQTQLFSDWYKYMLCAYPPDDARHDYPDIDEVRHFIAKNDVLPVRRQSGRREALKSRLAQLHGQVAAQVDEFSRRTARPHALQPLAAPRFWQPREPVLLIVDDEAASTRRHGHDGPLQAGNLLECHVRRVQARDARSQLAEIRGHIASLALQSGHGGVGAHAWKAQPWHPFALEWQVELHPIGGDKNNLDPIRRDYDAQFITSSYRLAEGAVDLVPKPGHVAVAKAASVFTGSSLLTPHARFQLQKEIGDYLERKAGESAFAKASLEQCLHKLRDPDFHALAQSLSGFNAALLMHKQTLQLPIAEPLGSPEAQAFTEGVRGAVGWADRNAPQPNNDFHPIRTGVLKIHALRVVDTFGRVQNLALKNRKVIASEVMSVRKSAHLAFLPPRLVQPARLNFRWLAAGLGRRSSEDEVQANAHPATTAVCGWLLPNRLDESVQVYDADGHALGSIGVRKRQWRPAPGASRVADERWNAHLWRLVSHLLERAHDPAGTFLDDFLEGIEIALERIDPEGVAQHTALALLLGRPLAVVRATLDVELRGRPAVNQDWNVFRSDLDRDLRAEGQGRDEPVERDTDAVAKVRIPIRLGDDRQLNDGLVGYWKERWSSDGRTCTYADDRFYVHACATAEVKATDPGTLADHLSAKHKGRLLKLLRDKGAIVRKHDLLRLPDGEALWTALCENGVLAPGELDPNIRYAADSADLTLALDDPPQKLTMLVDPRGVVHASCGMLPTKVLAIPPDQYAGALQSLAVTFVAGPLLSGDGPTVRVPLPTQPGHAWSWVEKSGTSWTETTSLKPAALEATFAEAQTIREGWLKLTKTKEGT